MLRDGVLLACLLCLSGRAAAQTPTFRPGAVHESRACVPCRVPLAAQRPSSELPSYALISYAEAQARRAAPRYSTTLPSPVTGAPSKRFLGGLVGAAVGGIAGVFAGAYVGDALVKCGPEGPCMGALGGAIVGGVAGAILGGIVGTHLAGDDPKSSGRRHN